MQGRIISREKQAVLIARAVDRAAARAHRLSRQHVQPVVAVVYLRARCVTRIAYFKLRQQSGRIAVGIRLARRSGAVIPRLTRQAVGLVVDVLCTLGERAVVILAASDEAAKAVVLIAVFLARARPLLCQRAGGVVGIVIRYTVIIGLLRRPVK